MSKEQVRTKFTGYKGPFFPKVIDDLNKVYDEIGATGKILWEIAIKIWPSVNVKKERSRTEDNYVWFWALIFETTNGNIAVLFPWCHDWDKKGGTLRTDRSIAVYTTGRVNDMERITMIERLRDEFLRLKGRVHITA